MDYNHLFSLFFLFFLFVLGLIIKIASNYFFVVVQSRLLGPTGMCNPMGAVLTQYINPFLPSKSLVSQERLFPTVIVQYLSTIHIFMF